MIAANSGVLLALGLLMVFFGIIPLLLADRGQRESNHALMATGVIAILAGTTFLIMAPFAPNWTFLIQYVGLVGSIASILGLVLYLVDRRGNRKRMKRETRARRH